MPKAGSGATDQTRSTRFLRGQRPKHTLRSKEGQRQASLPSLIRLAELVTLFSENDTFLHESIKIDVIYDVDDLISRFLKQVNDHYFPINTQFLSDGEEFYHPALQGVIPVRPRGFSNWHYDDPITLIMILASMEEDPHPALDALACDYPQFDELPWNFKLSLIPLILDEMELEEPLGYLTDLINMATRRTGTFFLDHSLEEYDFYSERGASINWSSFNIEWLKNDWKRAKPIHQRVWKLIDWTMANQEKRTKVLMELIQKAWIEVEL